jgi:very-short-patch-repair endonuclease
MQPDVQGDRRDRAAVGEEVAETLRFLGGSARWRELRVVHPRRDIRVALEAGLVERAARGRYVVTTASEQRRRAAAAVATLSHLSAAVAHGWKVKTVPEAAWVTVRRKRHLRREDRKGLLVHWADLPDAVVARGVTPPLRTVLDCARVLAFDEALAVADSALRSGAVTAEELRSASARLRGTGSRAARLVAQYADHRAANPFESVLRALALLEGFTLTPQLQITEPGLYAVVDLGSEDLMLAVEADGFEHHGTRRAMRKDCRRHTELAVFGWSTLRFPFEDVMFQPAWTRWALRSWRVVRDGGVPDASPLRMPGHRPWAGGEHSNRQ